MSAPRFRNSAARWAKPILFHSCSIALAAYVYPREKGSDDAMLDLAIEAGAEECVSSEEGHEFLTSVEDFGSVRDALEAKLGEAKSAKIVFRPQNMVAVKDEAGEALIKLLDVLDDHDDIQTVYGNYEFSDALLEKMSG